MRRLAVCALACCVHAEIVDRLAATVGYEVITESQVLAELRTAAFLEGAPPDTSVANRRKTVDRLIDQVLLRREVEFTRFPAPTEAEVAPLLGQVRARYPNDEAFRRAQADGGVTAEALRAALAWELTTLRFIEYRFQPAVQVSDSLIRREYRKQAAAWREKNQGEVPSLDAMRPELEKIARAQLTDSALDRWLGEMRTQSRILYLGDYR